MNPEFAQLKNGDEIYRFGWVEKVDFVSIVFYNDIGYVNHETYSKEKARELWRHLKASGWKPDGPFARTVTVEDQSALLDVMNKHQRSDHPAGRAGRER